MGTLGASTGPCRRDFEGSSFERATRAEVERPPLHALDALEITLWNRPRGFPNP